MRYLKTDRLYCFSPLVMLVTFIIEIGLAIYVVARYKMTPVTRLAAVLLIGLATFQWAEYNVCEGSWGLDSLTWARIGYVAITLLPPLGIHLATVIAGQKQRGLVAGSYALAALFSVYFLFVGHGMQGSECMGNYVIFDVAKWTIIPYALYYYGLLIVAVAYSLWASQGKAKRTKFALYSLAAGYAAFIIPTTAVNIVDPSTIAGIPSIMCGFAVIMAIVLAGFVVPNSPSVKTRNK